MIRIRTEACSLYSSSPKKFFEHFVFAGWASSSEYAFSVYICYHRSKKNTWSQTACQTMLHDQLLHFEDKLNVTSKLQYYYNDTF